MFCVQLGRLFAAPIEGELEDTSVFCYSYLRDMNIARGSLPINQTLWEG